MNTWAGATLLLASVACSSASTGTTLAAPSELTVTTVSGGGHLVWKDNSADEDGFEIERRSTGDYARLASVVFDIRQYHDGEVTPGLRHSYRVRATRGDEVSGYSNEVELLLDATPRDGGVSAPDAAGADAAGADAAATAPDAAVMPLSFQRDIVPIFNQSCGAGDNGCHSSIAYLGNRDQDCRGWLSLENRALGSMHPNTGAPTGCADRSLHERLVQLDAWMCDPRRRYVVAGSATDSQLHSVISGRASMNGTCNKSPGMPLGAMPPPGSAYRLSAASAQLIADWIAAGAPNN